MDIRSMSPREINRLPLGVTDITLLMMLVNKYYPNYTMQQKQHIYNLLVASGREVILDHFEKIHNN